MLVSCSMLDLLTSNANKLNQFKKGPYTLPILSSHMKRHCLSQIFLHFSPGGSSFVKDCSQMPKVLNINFTNCCHLLGLSLTTRETRRDSPCLVSKPIDLKTASYLIVCSIFNSECTCMWCSYLWTLWLLIDAQYSFYYQVYVFIIIICFF